MLSNVINISEATLSNEKIEALLTLFETTREEIEEHKRSYQQEMGFSDTTIALPYMEIFGLRVVIKPSIEETKHIMCSECCPVKKSYDYKTCKCEHVKDTI